MLPHPTYFTLFPYTTLFRSGSSTKAQLEGISDYFQTPLKIAMSGGSGSGDSSSVIKGGGTDFTRQNGQVQDRKSTRLNSSHLVISYAVFCLKKTNNCNKHLG